MTSHPTDQFLAGDPVEIAGAGMAGMAAAIHLKTIGKNVVVYEKHSAVGAGRHGDYEGLENWIFNGSMNHFFSRLGFDFPSLISYPVYQFFVHSAIQSPKRVHSTHPFFYLVRRGPEEDCLDEQLYQQCLSAGVHFRLGTQAPDGCHIISTGSKKAKALIQGINFITGLENQVHLLLGSQIAPKGYAYLIVSNGKATLAVAFKKQKNQKSNPLKQSIEHFQSQGFTFPGKTVFGSYGSFSIPIGKRFSHPIHIGERGGFQDYLFGFGMRVAMESGLAAAKQLADDSVAAQIILRSLSKKCKISYVNRCLYEQLNDQQILKMADQFSNSDEPLTILEQAYKWNFKNIRRWIRLKGRIEIRTA